MMMSEADLVFSVLNSRQCVTWTSMKILDVCPHMERPIYSAFLLEFARKFLKLHVHQTQGCRVKLYC